MYCSKSKDSEEVRVSVVGGEAERAGSALPVEEEFPTQAWCPAHVFNTSQARLSGAP